MSSHRAQLAFKRGQEWEERGNLSKAINAYREAAAIHSGWLAPQLRLGALFLEMGRYDESLDAYRQAEPLAPPGDGSVAHMLGVLERIQAGTLDPVAYHYYEQAHAMPDEQLNEKLRLCQQALALNADFCPPYVELGRVLLAQGQPNQARVVLERGLDCGPDPFIRAALLFNLGNVLLFSNQREGALDCFRQVTELDANPDVTHYANMQLKAASEGRI